MSRSGIIGLIAVLIVANILVFINLGLLLWNGFDEAMVRISVTREPTSAPAPAPPSPTSTPAATATSTTAPTATSAPAAPTTATATAVNAAATTPAPSATLPAAPSLTRAAIPFYTPGAPLKYPFRYIVQAGDALSVLAATFKVPVAKILAANGMTDPNLIRIGQELIIPDPAQ